MSDEAWPSGERSLNVIPLNPSERLQPEDRGDAMREAALQAVTDLMIERVSPNERSPYFEQARDLVLKAGWSPEELLAAADPGAEQDALLEQLGIETVNRG
jgi:hypothetical protein